jgi:alkaline phosphatase D
MKYKLLFIVMLLATVRPYAQMLLNGPMVGYSSMRESVVWVQTKVIVTAQLRYWAVATPTDLLYSQEMTTLPENGYTAHLIADRLEPGTTYNYEVLINGQMQTVKSEQKFKTQTLWKWRTDAPDVTFVAGSCFYVNDEKYDRPGKAYGGGYQILQSIYKDKPEFMVWLGDNTYLREADWDSKSGIYYRYTHTRKIEELRPLLANTHHYAIWDDHDYGPNDSDRSYYGKHWTLQAFKNFWANPTYGVGGTEGITASFSWSDGDFFLLDNRWYRTGQSEDGQILGPTQMAWLTAALKYSEAKYKFVCIGGQFLNTLAKFENYAIFKKERQQLLDAIDSMQIKGVIFLDGDRHHSEISRWTGAKGTTIYDVTSSSLTSANQSNKDEINANRIDGSLIMQQNYALIQIVGSKDKREVKVTFKDTFGTTLFEYKIAY